MTAHNETTAVPERENRLAAALDAILCRSVSHDDAKEMAADALAEYAMDRTIKDKEHD